MSQLLQSFTSGGSVNYLDDTLVPTGFHNGLPVDNGALAVDTTGSIDHHSQGLPFTAEGRLAVDLDQYISHFGPGSAPISDNGRFVIDPIRDPKAFAGGVPFSARIGQTERVFQSSFGADPAARNPHFDFYRDGDTLYAAQGSNGWYSYDISNIANGNVTSISSENKYSFTTYPLLGSATSIGYEYRSVLILGGFLYAVTRFRVGDDPYGGGAIEQWNISTPSAPVLVDRYYRENVAPNSDPFSRFTQMCTDGTDIFVFGQVKGIYKFNPASIGTGPTASNETGWSPQGTHGGDVIGNYLHACFYGNGLRYVDKATLTTTDASIPAFNNGRTIRPWDAVANGNYLYVSSNRDDDWENRGLLVVDCTNPPGAYAWDAFEGYPPQDNAPANDTGDNANTGIAFLDDRIYIAHGNRGFLTYDVSTPLSPRYLGLAGNMDIPDVTFGVTAFNKDSVTYLVYGSGMQPLGESTLQMYIDRVTV